MGIVFIKNEGSQSCDHYTFADRSQLSSKDVTISVDFSAKEITGEVVAYGS